MIWLEEWLAFDWNSDVMVIQNIDILLRWVNEGHPLLVLPCNLIVSQVWTSKGGF